MIYVWLVEEFSPDGSSTGRYMLDRGSLAITYDVYAARRLRREMSAAFSALDMEEKHGGDWRPVEHGFLHSPEPAPQAEPAAVGELPPLTDEQIAFCIFEARMEAGTFKRDGTMSFRIARAVEREVRAAIASAPHAREPLNFDRLQSVMAAHFGGRELTDDEADSAEAFARAIERAHGIGA